MIYTIRLLLVSLFLTLLELAGFAQDILHYADGQELNVKVVEILPKVVKYKRFDNLDGPLISESRTKLFMVKYENGTKENLSITSNQPSGASEERKPQNASASTSSSIRIEQPRVEELRDRWKNRTFEENMARHKQVKKAGVVLTSIGVSSLAIGGVFYGIVWANWNNPNQSYSVSDGLYISGSALFGIGGVNTIIGGIHLGNARKWKRNAQWMDRSEYDYAKFRSKRYIAPGIVLLSTGGISLISGVALLGSAMNNENFYAPGIALTTIGGTSMIVGGSLLGAARKWRKRADKHQLAGASSSIGFKMEQSTSFSGTAIQSYSVPSLSISLKF